MVGEGELRMRERKEEARCSRRKPKVRARRKDKRKVREQGEERHQQRQGTFSASSCEISLRRESLAERPND